MDKRRLESTLHIGFGICLFTAGISLILAFLFEQVPYFLFLTALSIILSLFFGFNLLVLLIFWD